MRRATRTIAPLLTAVLALGGVAFIAAPAQAAIATITIGDLTYEYDDAEPAHVATITAYSGPGGDVVLPSSIDVAGTPHTVTRIGNDVFDAKDLTAVALPESLKSIGQRAFRDNLLTTVAMPSTLTSVGPSAFSGNQLQSVDLNSGLTSIDQSAFRDNLLTTVDIPDSVTSIVNIAFYNNKLTDVTLGTGLTFIGNSAFDANLLTTITIPSNVTALGVNAFDNNSGLVTVKFLGNAPLAVNAGTVLESFDSSNPALLLHYTLGATGFTSPLWKNYPTIAEGTVGTFAALQGATSSCTGSLAIKLTADISDPSEVSTNCNTQLDLNGHDLAVRNVALGNSTTLTVGDATGTDGTLTADASASVATPGVRTTGATLVINSGTVVAKGGDGGAGIGGSRGATGGNGGVLTINGTANVTATGGGGAAGIGGGAGSGPMSDGGSGGTITIGGSANVTAKGLIGGTGIGGGSASATAGAGADLTIGQHAKVTAYTGVGGLTAIGASSGGGGATLFGHLTVAGTLRLPSGSIYIPDGVGDEVEVTSTGLITGSHDDVPTEASVTGDGQIDNAGTITLATAKVTADEVQVKDHHYKVSFDAQGGSAAPDDVTVYSESFDNGWRMLPTPTKVGSTFGGWYTETDGGGTQIGAGTILAGSSIDGTPVTSTLYANWTDVAPSLTGDPTATGEVGTSFTYTPTLDASSGTTVTSTGDALPDGLTLDATTGVITGTPLAGTGGTYELTLTADNDVEPNATLDVTVTINEAPDLDGAASADGVIGQPFSYGPAATGYPTPTVTLDSGSLPAGVTLTAGELTGTPTVTGSFPITLKAANGIASAATLSVNITIATSSVTGLAPTISGTVREGKTLTANTGPVVPGSATFVYRWIRDGRNISGATSATYKLKKNDAGHRVTVRITARSPGYTPHTATSGSTGLVSSPHGRIVLSTKTVKKGTSFGLVATGLKPGQVYRIWLGGKETYTGHANSQGTVTRTARFKSSVKPGTRRVRVSGYNSKGKRTFTVLTRVTYKK